jgi:hypothetical protein
MADVPINADGTASALFFVSKTDQNGEGAVVAVSAESAQRVRRWIEHGRSLERIVMQVYSRSFTL